jgi:uncharacterized protein (AIM24 family)
MIRMSKYPRKTRRIRRIRGGETKTAITAKIIDQASTQVLKITMPPGSAIVTDQNTMSFMTGNLTTKSSLSGGSSTAEKQNGAGIFNALKRAFSGESFLMNQVVNSTDETAEITLSPTIPSAIVEIAIQPGDEWKLYPGCFIAGTSNVSVSGSINIFDNFKSSFVTGSAIYTTLRVPPGGEEGRVWISGFGGIEKRDIKPTTTPFILNNGIFLAMPGKYWNDYVKVGTPGGILDSFLTSIGFVMKIQADNDSPSHPTIPLYLQTINVHNFKQMIRTIASEEAASARTTTYISSGISDEPATEAYGSEPEPEPEAQT